MSIDLPAEGGDTLLAQRVPCQMIAPDHLL